MGVWSEVSKYKGRNDLPAILSEYWDDLDEFERPEALANTWASAEWPQQHLDYDEWVTMFTDTGFITDKGDVECTSATATEVFKDHINPDGTITVWRGAVEGCEFGMSWTLKREVAEWFYNRFGTEGRVLLSMDLPLDYALAFIEGRSESEVVVEIEALLEDVGVVYECVEA